MKISKNLVFSVILGLALAANVSAKDNKACMAACKTSFDNAKKECSKMDKMMKASCNETAAKSHKDCVKACKK